MTSKEFLDAITQKPDFCAGITEPLHIQGNVDCEGHSITVLSQHLVFENEAVFRFCENLKTATGTFLETCSFAVSRVENIESLYVKQTCSFLNCVFLKKANGTFDNCVDFENSGIEKIENLRVNKPNKHKIFADFTGCEYLQNLENWDLSKKIRIEPEKLEKEIRRRESLRNYQKTSKGGTLPFL
jgi:hypothetical protein